MLQSGPCTLREEEEKKNSYFIRALCILWSGVLERSVGVEYWSEVESDFGVANVGHSFAPKHNRI